MGVLDVKGGVDWMLLPWLSVSFKWQNTLKHSLRLHLPKRSFFKSNWDVFFTTFVLFCFVLFCFVLFCYVFLDKFLLCSFFQGLDQALTFAEKRWTKKERKILPCSFSISFLSDNLTLKCWNRIKSIFKIHHSKSVIFRHFF